MAGGDAVPDGGFSINDAEAVVAAIDGPHVIDDRGGAGVLDEDRRAESGIPDDRVEDGDAARAGNNDPGVPPIDNAVLTCRPLPAVNTIPLPVPGVRAFTVKPRRLTT